MQPAPKPSSPSVAKSRPSDAAIAFLQQLGAHDWHNLFAIVPDGPVEGRTFAPGEWAAMAEWIDARHATRNLYFSVNEPRPGAPHDKLSKSDIAAIRCISVDQDTEAGTAEECEAVRAALIRAVKNEVIPTPSIVIDTGNGVQSHWLLSEKVAAERMQDWAEGQSRAFGAKVDGDSTFNIDRILRLPGTNNLPKAKKREKGRVPRPTRILNQLPYRYKPTELSAAVPPLPKFIKGGGDLDGLGERIAEVQSSIESSGWDLNHGFADLDPSTLAKLEEAKATDPGLIDLLAGILPEGADDSGSGYRLQLARRLDRAGRFDEVEFASICHAWHLAHGTNALTPRLLARDWVRFGEASSRFIADSFKQSDQPAAAPSAEVATGMVAVDDLVDPQTLPVRELLIAPRVPIGDVSQLVGEPGVSKSSLVLRDGLAVASGDERILRGSPAVAPDRLHRTGPVIIYNAEDRLVEMKRRLRAAQLHFGVGRLKHPIHLWSGVDGEQITLLKRNGTTAHSPLAPGLGVDLLRAAVKQTGAVMVVLDPQVGLSGGVVPENDTDGMDFMLTLLAKEAASMGIAIQLCHHTSKTTRNDAGDMGAGRGAFSVAGKLRSMATLMNVSAEDAKAWGFQPGDLVRLDYAKISHDRKPSVPTILRRVSVAVGNGTEAASKSAGELFEGSPAEHLRRIGDYAPVLEVIGLGKPKGGEDRATNDAGLDRTRSIARAVLAAIGNSDEAVFADYWVEIGAELTKVGVTKTTTRHLIQATVTLALVGEGVLVDRGGQNVRVRAEREGPGAKAPWKIVVEAASANEPAAVDATHANGSVFA